MDKLLMWKIPRALLVSGALTAGLAMAQPRIDNVLVKMVPPGVTSLVGARMDRIRNTELYRKLMEQQKLPQVDRFAQETGFDPRRDVRELLFAGTETGGVLLARGTFQVKPDPLRQSQAKPVRHGEYVVWTLDTSGFCILDKSLVAAGDLKSLEAALDEWKNGKHVAAKPLLAQATQIDQKSELWGVSTGFATFLADNMPRAGNGGNGGIDFSKIFRGLENTWFQADFDNGVQAEVRGNTATEKDAQSLRDMAKGLIGFARLSVPENQTEALKLWDGVVVEQQVRSVAIRMNIARELMDKLVQMLNSAQSGRGRGGRGAAQALQSPSKPL